VNQAPLILNGPKLEGDTTRVAGRIPSTQLLMAMVARHTQLSWQTDAILGPQAGTDTEPLPG
jgi:hypothetical protein